MGCKLVHDKLVWKFVMLGRIYHTVSYLVWPLQRLRSEEGLDHHMALESFKIVNCHGNSNT